MTSRSDSSVLPRIISWLTCALAWEFFAHLHKNPKLFPSFEHILFESLPQISLFDPTCSPGILGVVEIILKNSAQTLKRIAGGVWLGCLFGLAFSATAYLIGINRQLG